MARFKSYSYEQTKLIPISYAQQILPGSFEYTLNEVIDTLDISLFENRYNNDATGAPAYDPRILLKIVLFAYSKGVVYSRRIAQLCQENIIFMALSADTQPHFTTIAHFVSSMEKEIVQIFRHVIQICMELDLIEGSMFAIDGVKLPSNASKEWSGTKADLLKKKEKLEQALSAMIDQHKHHDTAENAESSDDSFKKRLEKARKRIAKLESWLSENEDKVSARKRTRQSNITDNESAKMKTSHGVIQGYNGIGVVDSKHQVIVAAEAFGEGQDTQLLQPALEGTEQILTSAGARENFLEGTIVAADTGFHATENLKYLEEKNIDGYVPDCNFRKRDPRFATADRHKGKVEKHGATDAFENEDFPYNKEKDVFVCPAGKEMHPTRSDLTTGGVTYHKYVAKQRICSGCSLRTRCITKEGKRPKPKAIFRRSDDGGKYTARMREKIDTVEGRRIYSKRMGIVEPVFGNIRWAKGLRRFSLQGKRKVNAQWNLFAIVHNLGKICTFGEAIFA